MCVVFLAASKQRTCLKLMGNINISQQIVTPKICH